MNLQLPQRSKPGKTSFNSSTDAIRNWIDQLPLLNTSRTAELVTGALEQINTLNIPVTQRFAALDLFTTPVMCTTDSMKKSFIGKPVPLHGPELELVRQTIELYNLMATGYRILADDLGSDNGQQQLLATAIHRALRYLSEILLTNYQIYVQYPDGLWSIMHALYTLAEKFGLVTQAITDTTLHTPEASSIDSIYKQILLLSLACPYRLRQTEIPYVYNELFGWAEASRLFNPAAADARGLFAVDLSRDAPPAYRALLSEQQGQRQLRLLDTSVMQQKMLQATALESGAAGRMGGLGSSGTMQRLMPAWGAMPKRRFSRKREHGQTSRLDLVVGLNAIHQMSAAPTPVEQHNNDISETISSHQYLQDPTFEAPTSIRTDFGIAHGKRSAPGAEHDRDNPLKGAYLANHTAAARHETWTMRDISAGGYCLLHEAEDASSVRIGELVAVPPGASSHPESLQVGVVRWLRFTREHGLELGLQLLSPGARAVSVSICEDEINRPERLQGVLLPEIKALRQPATLLLPSLPFRTGCRSMIQDGDTNAAIILTRQLENTGCFAHYDFSRTDQ